MSTAALEAAVRIAIDRPYRQRQGTVRAYLASLLIQKGWQTAAGTTQEEVHPAKKRVKHTAQMATEASRVDLALQAGDHPEFHCLRGKVREWVFLQAGKAKKGVHLSPIVWVPRLACGELRDKKSRTGARCRRRC